MTDWSLPKHVPLRTAIAWITTRDLAFARTVHNPPSHWKLSKFDPLGSVTLVSALHGEMIAAGVFPDEPMPRDKWVTVHCLPRSGYAGRFADLVDDFATDDRASAPDRRFDSMYWFLLHRFRNAGRDMLAARVPMEDARGEISGPLLARCSIDETTGCLVEPGGALRKMVTVYRDALLQEFPAPPHAAGTAAAETKCRKWLEKEVERHKKGRPKSKGAYRKEAIDAFDGLAGRGFERAWQSATANAPGWRRAGRPRKSEHSKS